MKFDTTTAGKTALQKAPIIEANIKADRAGHFKEFQKHLFAGINRDELEPDATDLLDAVIASWFGQHYPAMVIEAENKAKRKASIIDVAENARSLQASLDAIVAEALRNSKSKTGERA